MSGEEEKADAIYKVYVAIPKEDEEKLTTKELVGHLRFEPEYLMFQPDNKRGGIIKMMEHLNADIKDVVVFGDDYNDMDMFCPEWFSIAMGNACQDLKDIANYVTDSNVDDGIKNACEHFGCDEAAYQLKETIKQHLQEAGHEVIDNGVGEGEVELYPDVAVRTCKKVTDGTCDRGILVCGTGIGMAMTANKVPGIRAAVCHDPFSTERSILSNDANVMCMGARVIAPQLALYLLDIWMGLTFKNGPSTPKVERIMEYQKEFCGK